MIPESGLLKGRFGKAGSVGWSGFFDGFLTQFLEAWIEADKIRQKQNSGMSAEKAQTATMKEMLIPQVLSWAIAGVTKPNLKADKHAYKPKDTSTVDEEISKNRNTSLSSNVNAREALRAKLSGLQEAQKSAVRIKNLPDGRIRYYDKETPAKKAGYTRGASFVTEYNPKNGNVRQWMESYDKNGNVIRVHPKSINGQTVSGQHYPPTGYEINQGIKK